MIHSILKMGDPRLLRVAPPVERFDTPELHALIEDMFETMAAAQGWAWPRRRSAWTCNWSSSALTATSAIPTRRRCRRPSCATRSSRRCPTTWKTAGKAACRCRGCAAWCGATATSATRAKDPYGRDIDREAEGFHARVVQHECDHLIGRLYPSRIQDFSKFGFTEILFPGMDPNQDD